MKSSLLLLLALFLGFCATLSYAWMWVGIARQGGTAFCGEFYPTGFFRWIEWRVEPLVLGGMLVVELWATWLVIKSVGAQLRETP